MIARCQYENGYCTVCLQPAPPNCANRVCKPGQPIRAPHGTSHSTVCIHRGEALETTVKVACKSCGGKQQMNDCRPHECAVHKRCLPNYRPRGEALNEWNARQPESSLYHLCAGCPDKEVATPARGAKG